MKDQFNGDNAKLVSAIEALLDLDSKGVLVPHGVGGHARTMLASAAVRLARQPAAIDSQEAVTGRFKRYDADGKENEHGALVFFHDVIEALAIIDAAPLDKESGKPAAQAPFVGMDREWTPEEKQGMNDALRKYGWRDSAPSVEQDERGGTKTFATLLMSAAAKSGDPKAIELAAHLAGVPPCAACGFVNYHCRCAAHLDTGESKPADNCKPGGCSAIGCDGGHYCFNKDGTPKPAAPLVEHNERGACELCKGVGKIGIPGKRCFACDGCGKSFEVRPASTSANVAQGAEAVTLDAAVRVFEQAACHETYRMREGSFHRSRVSAAAEPERAHMSKAMSAYLRVCSSGGMPAKQRDQVNAAFEQALDLGYFDEILAKRGH
jgi:hypothetical protein